MDNITSTCLSQVPTIQRKELMTTNVKDSRKQVVMSSGYGYLLTGVLDGWTSFGLFTNCVIEMTSLMTSSGPSEKLHGGTSQRSTFFNLGQAELLRVRCTICLNSNRHLVIGPFQKVEVQTDGVAGWQSCTWTACTRIACTGIRSVTGIVPF